MNNFTDLWDDKEFPLAYLITLRTYGTRLHGDKRSSIDVHHGQNKRRSLKAGASENLEISMNLNMKNDPFVFSKTQRINVDLSIRETCTIRGFDLLGLTVRTNHLHAVISAACKPEGIITDLKRYATRRLIEGFLINRGERVWSRGGSRRYLWKKRDVDMAIDYVLYGQGKLDFK